MKLQEETLINFIPESYNIDKIEKFFENFILSNEKNKIPKNLKNKALFDFYFGRLVMLNVVRNEEFNLILDKIRNKYKLKEKDIDIFKEFLKEKSEEYLEQLSETDMLKELLDHIYNIDNFERKFLIPFSNCNKMTDELKIKILNSGKNVLIQMNLKIMFFHI